MSSDRTLFERAADPTGPPTDTDDADPEPVTRRGSIAARKTRIDGEQVDLAEPRTQITFEDDAGLLSGEWGRPRPREFWTAKQLGRTPPMELLKNVVSRQLIGGEPIATVDDGELQGPMADFADMVLDIYRGPHYHNKTLDNLIVDAINDMIDFGWAYWEFLPSEDGEYPVAGFKPLPPLQIQHNLDKESGEFVDDPAFFQVPYKRQGGTVTTVGKEPVAIPKDGMVVMRDPLATESDTIYGQSLATKVREWLELIIDVDVHQKRHFSDSQLPAGFLHFLGAIDDEKLTEVEQDIVEASGDPHDLVTVSTEDQASWIPVGESVVDLDAIQQQEWYYALVFAAAGLNLNELGIIEGSGFAKETPALARQVYKNVTKPMMGAIFDPQNAHTLDIMAEPLSITDIDFRLGLERFDPVQEQIEREETEQAYTSGALSLNEYRGGLGREAAEFTIEIGGEEQNLADVPKDILTLLKSDLPNLEELMGDGEAAVDSGEAGMASHAEPGPPDFEQDPVLSEQEAFAELGKDYNPRVVRQLEDTVEVESSFLVSAAYSRTTDFLQLEFERDGTNAVYWYGNVPEYRFFNFLRADSKGKYFNRYIRGEYFYARLQ